MSKVNSVILRALSDIILLEHNHPSFQMISVVKVDTAKDLSNAKIYVNSLKNNEELVKYLKKLTPVLQKKLSKIVKLRKLPALRFEIDTETEYLNHMNQLIQEHDIGKEAKKVEAGET